MNAGLSNLATLKGWLLAASLVDATDYDAQILAIGQGVALALEKYCNRKFGRAVGATFECTADRTHVVLDRYPVEALTTIEQRDTLAGGWSPLVINDVVENRADDRGLVYFNAPQGIYLSRLRFTYTGGFFFEQLEPADVGYPTATPAGATALPADLLLAWKLQCEHVWTQRDKLGLQLAKEQSTPAALAAIELLPVVKEHLRPFVRYALS